MYNYKKCLLYSLPLVGVSSLILTIKEVQHLHEICSRRYRLSSRRYVFLAFDIVANELRLLYESVIMGDFRVRYICCLHLSPPRRRVPARRLGHTLASSV
jgi:hypothetical protein